MINGPMAEAQNGYVTLESVDDNTMERFIEWAYKGYYTPASFSRDPSGVSLPDSSAKEDRGALADDSSAAADCEGKKRSHGEAFSGGEDALSTADALLEDHPLGGFRWRNVEEPQAKKSTKPKTKKILKNVFLLHRYGSHPGKIGTPDTHPRANQEPDENYTEVFLSHARLHVFADMYDIQPLKTLAFDQLHYTLAIFTLHRQRTGDIVNLLRYVYANTTLDVNADAGHLRTMLKQYVAYEMSALMKDERFNELLIEDGGPLLADFMKMVAYRIH